MRYLPACLLRATSAAALFFFASCGGGEPTGPEPTPTPVAGSLTLVSGDAQTGTVGAALTAPLVVTVKDTNGSAMSGQSVSWSVASGAGTVSQGSTTSAGDGTAAVTWTLGGTPGAQSVTATAASFSVTFTATAEVGPVATVVVTPTTGTLESLEATVQLAAEVKDAFGNTAQGTVTWSSSDEAVLTVDDQGVAKAVANGTADVVATSGDLTGKATLTVAQAVATVSVTPDNPTAAKGGTVQLAAAATDANGFAVPDATFTWTSSDQAVATVDASGLVSGVEEGSAVITATSGSASDTVTVTVSAAPFKPTEDTEISGTVNVAEVDIPAGVTVTLKDDAVINATGNVTIAGTLTGDCVGASVTAGGTLTLTGDLRVACADTTRRGGDLVIQSSGELTLDGLTLSASGAVRLGNVPPAASGVAALRVSRAGEGSAPCRIRDVDINLGGKGFGSSGTNGVQGTDGGQGAPVEIRCAGNLVLEGGRFEPGWGGHGGGGMSTTDEPAVGGNGGGGGDVFVTAGGDITFGKSPTTGNAVRFQFGAPGGAGGAYAISENPTAVGGNAGRFGLPFVEAGGSILIREEGGLAFGWFGWVQNAGHATAVGKDGEDATDTQAAEAAGKVTATGGDGAIIGLPDQQTNVLGTLFKGEVINPLFMFIAESPALGRNGGNASGLPGNGGNGSEAFPDGAKGGSAHLTGGKGGSVTLWDNRWNRYVSQPAFGGDLLFGRLPQEVRDDSGNQEETPPPGRYHAMGGRGWSDCVVGNIKAGGKGGEGGAAMGIVGQGGSLGSTPGNGVGGVRYYNWGSGGHAGDGTNEPTGGAAGDASLVLGETTESTNSFNTGTDGNGCAIIVEPAVSVTSDNNGHAPFIALAPSQLTVTPAADGTVTISGNGNWVTVTGTVDASGNFTANGTGTVAGFTGVPVTFEGTLSLDADGRVTGIQSGTLTMDATNSNLPANSEGQRNPAVYSVTGSKIG